MSPRLGWRPTRVLAALLHTPGRDAASIADLRSEVLLSETLSLLDANPQLRSPAVATLFEYDTTHGAELVTSLLAYLDALGDVSDAAARSPELAAAPDTPGQGGERN